MQPISTPEQDAAWLVENANTLLYNETWPADVLELTTLFRKQFSPARSHLLCELLELRHRAKAKFIRANEMFFHRRGLEQATDERIANYKAARILGSSRAETGRMADICCGVGGDAIALANNGKSLTIIDRDPAVALFAQANIHLHSNSNVTTIVRDARDVHFAEYTLWHIDPDRRADDQRRSDPQQCEPPLSEFLASPGLGPHGAIKLSPAADASELLDQGAELEWIGHDRECQQQIAWLGELARFPGKRTATWLDDTKESPTQIVEQDDEPIGIVEQTPRYLYEPKASVLAARLDFSIASKFGLEQLTAQAAYFASDRLINSPLLSVFEIIDEMPFHRKALGQRLAALHAKVVEIKKRGVTIDPHALQKELRRAEGDAVVLLLYKRSEAVRVVVAKRIESP